MTKKTAFKIIFSHRNEIIITEQDVRDMIYSGLYSGNPRLEDFKDAISTYSVKEAEA